MSCDVVWCHRFSQQTNPLNKAYSPDIVASVKCTLIYFSTTWYMLGGAEFGKGWVYELSDLLGLDLIIIY